MTMSVLSYKIDLNLKMLARDRVKWSFDSIKFTYMTYLIKNGKPYKNNNS